MRDLVILALSAPLALLVSWLVACYVAGFISAAVADFRNWRNKS